MAVIDINNWDGYLGKSGGFVTYRQGNKIIRRSIGKSTKPPTEKQNAQRMKATLSNNLNKPVTEFIKIGFKTLAEQADKLPHALMNSHTLTNAIKGEYPNLEIDYSKVLFSKGTMPLTPGLSVTLKSASLEFKWDPTPKGGDLRADDQLMILVYFPEKKDAEFVVGAAVRSSGSAIFPLLKDDQARVMEIYIAFISVNRERISNSVYLGQMVLPAIANNQLTLWL